MSRSSFLSRCAISSINKHDVTRHTNMTSLDKQTQTTYFYIYSTNLVGGGRFAPPSPRARKSLRAILVTRHSNCVPVFHL